MFHALSARDLSSIVHIQLQDLVRRLSEQEISLQLLPGATKFILDASYVPAFGARPLRRYLEKHITTAVSKLLIEGRLKKRTTVVIDAAADGSGLTFEVRDGAPAVPTGHSKTVPSARQSSSRSSGSKPAGSPIETPFKKSKNEHPTAGGRAGGLNDGSLTNEDSERDYMDE